MNAALTISPATSVSAPVCCGDDRNPRRRERTISDSEIHSLIDEAIEAAALAGEVRVFSEHGGSVANAYNYPAVTQCVVVIAGPDGRCCWMADELPANKVTHAGCAERFSHRLRPIFDGRYGEAAQDEAREYAAGLLDLHCPRD